MTSYVSNPQQSAMANTSPLAFVFSGNEMIVQCTANNDDQAAAVNTMAIAMKNYQNFNDGKHAAIVRRKDSVESTQYWITSVPYAETLDKGSYEILKTTEEPAAQGPIVTESIGHKNVSKVHIRRPRNQFIIYRQWMSARIHSRNPGVTAACISQIVAQMWRDEKPEIKARFKDLADEGTRMHKAKYPGYRYVAGRRNPQLPLSKRNLPLNPMLVDERLIAAGF
ncbi:mat A-3 [Chaetomidium leptoderma]|uniref:Mat A-3 n=1 Tax=Chaetomidium leptoderma TaxID=669021 RepID=A0AAN6VNI3_9PEZI|nr:mat A-3 [Chaetomidium leptoderma]